MNALEEAVLRGRFRRPGSRHSRVFVGVTLLLVGSNLRPAIVAISPLLPEIRRSTGLSPTLAGLLTTLPLVCFGVFAFLTPPLSRRFGHERLLALLLVALTAGTCLRIVPGVAALFVGTTLAGASIAVANVLLPALIKREFPDHLPLITGLYATALAGGAALAAGMTVPLGRATGLGWRPVLALWALPVLASLLLLTPIVREAVGRRSDVPGSRAHGSLWRDRVAWAVTFYMGLQSLGYYATVAWLPSLFQAHGVSASGSGWLVSYAGFVSIPACLAAPLIGRRLPSHRPLVIAATATTAVALVGLAIDPGHLAVLWMTALGLGQGAAFSLALGFITHRAPDVEHVAQLSMFAQGGGYVLAALGPVMLGAVHEITMSWTAPVLALLALLGPQLMSGVAAARDRYVVTSRVRSPNG